MDDLVRRIRESRPTTESMSVDVHDLVQRARRRDVAGRVVLGVALLAATGATGVALATALGPPADEVELAPAAPTAPTSPAVPSAPAESSLTEEPTSPSEPMFTELPEPTVPERPVPQATESSTACGPQAVAADIDGDGAADAVEHVYEDRTVLRICVGTGERWEIEGLWGAEFLGVADVEEDGRAEIFYGGSSVSMIGAQIVVWEEGAPRVVVDGAGVPLVVESGYDLLDDEAFGPAAHWGCEDRTGDGTRELVTMHADKEGDAIRWLVTGYRLEGSTAVEVSSEEVGGADPPPVEPCVEPGP